MLDKSLSSAFFQNLRQGGAAEEPAAAAARSRRAVEGIAGADVAAYKLELDACIAQGKDAGSLAVYETCARAADARHGLDGGAR